MGKMGNRTLRTPTRAVHPQGQEHIVLPRKTAMKPKDTRPIRLTTDATDDIVCSDDEFDEPIISALGKRDRLGGPSRRADAKGDSSGGEAERPNKNRVSVASSSGYSDKPDF